MSPKYLIGESYGTVRAVAVAERLSTRHAMAFNGIVLVSACSTSAARTSSSSAPTRRA